MFHLGITEMKILATLYDHPATPWPRLSKMLYLSQTCVHRYVLSLMEKGLIRRELAPWGYNSHGPRPFLYSLTDAGCPIAEHFAKARDAVKEWREVRP